MTAASPTRAVVARVLTALSASKAALAANSALASTHDATLYEATGTPTPPRAALLERLQDAYLADTAPADGTSGSPHLVLTAGPPGAGKTTALSAAGFTSADG